jgi:hypothetical protein
MAVCCMLLPHNPCRLPQHYKRHICGPSCSCKRQYLWVSPIFEHYFCLNYMGTVCHWQPFWSTTRVRYIGQCWYFNPQWTAGQARNRASCVSKGITHWENCAVAMCWHMNQGFWRGLGRGGGPFSLHRETLTFMGPAANQNTVVFKIEVNKTPPNFNTLFATSLWVVWLFKGLTA